MPEENHNLRIAFVQDALPFVGGAEKVLAAALEVFPQASIYTLVHNRKALLGTVFAHQKIHTSFIDRLPAAHKEHRTYLPLFPFAVEQFDLRGYDLILSFSYAAAHGILPRPDQLHISFIYTPLRYAWHYYHQYLHESGLHFGLKALLVKLILHYLRLWDQAAASRVDRFVAISQWVARCIWRAYRRPAQVIYPPVEIQKFLPLYPRDEYYIAVSRLVQHKQLAMIVDVFSRLNLPLIVIGDGPERSRLIKLAAPNVKLLGRQPDETVQRLLGRAKACVHAAEEDFGITLVEAQAAGCPVIAFGKGGALETVEDEKTGLLFQEQSVESLAGAIEKFESGRLRFSIADLQANASRFDTAIFKRKIAALVAREWKRFKCDGEGYASLAEERFSNSDPFQ